jgi:hypothetical protein
MVVIPSIGFLGARPQTPWVRFADVGVWERVLFVETVVKVYNGFES